MTLQEAIRSAIETGAHFRRVSWCCTWERGPTSFMSQFNGKQNMSLDWEGKVSNGYGHSMLTAGDILANDWEMAPADESEERVNSWVPGRSRVCPTTAEKIAAARRYRAGGCG